MNSDQNIKMFNFNRSVLKTTKDKVHMIQELHMVRSKYKKNSGLNYFLVSSEIPVHVFVDHFVQSSDIGLSYRVIIGQ